MTTKSSPPHSSSIISTPTPPIAESGKLDVGEEVTISSSSRAGTGAESAPFRPQVADMHEAVRIDDPAELELFMLEELTITTNPPMGENDDRIINFKVRNLTQNICLGSTQKVRRCFVEALARCRSASVSAGAVPVSTSSDTHTYKNTTTMNTKPLKYPFGIVHDPSGIKGIQWYNQILRDRL